MNKIYYILLLITFGCYDDDNELIISENVSHNTSELTTMVKSMSLHNASFDNVVDNTSCFSLEFPYQVNVNSELKNISSVNDLSEVSEEDDVEIIFPVNINFYNYELHEAINQTDFNLVKNVCAEDFNLTSHPCLDFQYPIVIKEYNNLTENFESFQLNNDKEVYLHFNNLHDNDIYEIEFPIFLVDSNSNSLRIDSNVDFMVAFNSTLLSCN